MIKPKHHTMAKAKLEKPAGRAVSYSGPVCVLTVAPRDLRHQFTQVSTSRRQG